MGLDQYAKFQSCDNPQHAQEFSYWRKHPNLQGWMEKLWREKGCPVDTDDGPINDEGGEFNCVRLYLTEEDIDRLEADIKEEQLPETTGFFFGSSCPEHAFQDLEFVKQAREHLQQGHQVFYFSWW